MKRHLSRRARIMQACLQFEILEQKQLLAADTLAPPLAANALESTVTALSSAASDDSLAMQARRALIAIPMTSAENRSFDGTNNNLINSDWGSAGEQLLRTAEAAYGDGVSSLAGESRPSAREISNALAAQEADAAGNERGLSALIYVWGQFLDHDLDLSTTAGSSSEAANIEVPTDDPYFDPSGTGTQVIPFSRSQYDPATGDSVGNPRQQVNEVTSWIDGSMVYGSDQATADSLRTFAGGKLRTSEGALLPTNDAGNFVAGDIRVNENPELTTMHTLFVREHNWWADRIAAADSTLTDEEIYQQARAIVIAEIQVITYNEFLPALLGEGALASYVGYDATVNPNIANEFSAAAFRLGHSLLNDDVEFFGNDGRAVHDEVSLSEAFFNPDLLKETGIDSILKYVASSQAQELDNQIVDSLRNFLFGAPGQGGLDLASLNIQRGRDHGLADFNTVREAYGLARVSSFVEITSNPELQQALSDMYDGVDDIDLWVGLLAEDHVAGSSTGETLRAIVSDQFQRLRDGDRFWYENIFTGRDLAQIQRTSLADIIARNTTVTNLQEDVFFMNAEVSGQVFLDQNNSGTRDRRERGAAGITVELLNDEGEVVDSTVTDRNGRYSFTNFLETGDYQIRLVLREGQTASTPTTIDVLVSRGGQEIHNASFGVSIHDKDGPAIPSERGERPRRDRADAIDQALVSEEEFDRLALASDLDLAGPRRKGGHRS